MASLRVSPHVKCVSWRLFESAAPAPDPKLIISSLPPPRSVITVTIKFKCSRIRVGMLLPAHPFPDTNTETAGTRNQKHTRANIWEGEKELTTSSQSHDKSGGRSGSGVENVADTCARLQALAIASGQEHTHTYASSSQKY
jgi:hypothetical protein